ncbi:hypothetical protein LTR56_027199 [Elasticomyces elasticus]|nr:hypothetical protein LTR56_027199 [Elasticomyces elasticus]KAK3615862.1 hypothetical protein LTR22_027274 [Elasticomyces elasticus]
MVPTSTTPGSHQDDLPDDDTTRKAISAGAKRLAADFDENTFQGSDSPSKRSRSTTSQGSRTSSPSKPNILRSLQHPIRNKSLDGTNLPNHAGVSSDLSLFACLLRSLQQILNDWELFVQRSKLRW